MNNGEKAHIRVHRRDQRPHTPKGQVSPVAPEEIVCINQRRDLHDRIDKLRLKETSALEPAYEKGLD